MCTILSILLFLFAEAVYNFSMPVCALTIMALCNLICVIYLATIFDRTSFINRLYVRVVFYGDITMATVNILSLLFYRFKKTLSCLNTATNIFFNLNYYSRLPTSRYWILIIVATTFLARLFAFGHNIKGIFNILSISVVTFMPYSVLAIVVILNSIMETAYRDINEQLLCIGCNQQYINDSRHQRLLLWNSKDVQKQRCRQSVLQALMTRHYKNGDLMLDMCSCFSFDVFITCFNCTMKTVLLAYIMYLSSFFAVAIWRYNVSLMIDMLFLVCIMCITTISCENVTLQVGW